MQAIRVHNCNKSQNHAPHDCATDAVTRISLAQPHDDKGRPVTRLAEGSNDQPNAALVVKWTLAYSRQIQAQPYTNLYSTRWIPDNNVDAIDKNIQAAKLRMLELDRRVVRYTLLFDVDVGPNRNSTTSPPAKPGLPSSSRNVEVVAPSGDLVVFHLECAHTTG